MQLQLQASPVLQHCRRKARRCNQGEEPISVSLRSRLFHREAMGNHVSREDFEWTKQEQPHNKRRTEILSNFQSNLACPLSIHLRKLCDINSRLVKKQEHPICFLITITLFPSSYFAEKYPQIKKLFGVDPTFKWKVVFLVLMQFMMVRLLSTSSWTVVVFAAYAIGGTINHALVLAEHEIAHHAAFGIQRPVANRLFGIFTNLPIGLPLSVAFKRYHRDHHRHLGEDTMDPDLPTRLEAKVFCTTFGKLLWIIVQPIFYVIRPLIVNPKVPENMEYVNAAIQVSFNCLVCYCFGELSFVLIVLLENFITCFRKQDALLSYWRINFGDGFAPGLRPLHLRALHFQERPGNLLLLWPAQHDHLQCGIPQ